MKKETGIFVLLAVLCTITAVLNHRFISAANLTNLANSIGLFGIFSIGLGIIIITGGIDLSVGSVFALMGVLLSIALTEWHWAAPLAIITVLLLGMLIGVVNALLITRLGVQPFVATLCGLLIYRGLARFIADDNTKGFGDGSKFTTLKFLATGRLFHREVLQEVNGVMRPHVIFEGIPMPFVLLLIVAAIMWFVVHRSIYGRYLMAVGRNEEAARFSGINTRMVIGSSYVIGGLLTAVSGILFAFYTNSISPSIHGSFWELYGIAAAVLGGCSLRGGEGSIIGILIGTALFQVLQNIVNLLSIPSSLNFTVMGTVVLIGVLADQLIQKRSKAKLTKSRS